MRNNLYFATLASGMAGVLGISVIFPSVALAHRPRSSWSEVTPPPQLRPSLQLARKPKTSDILVTEAQIASDFLANTWFHTLSGTLANRSSEAILNPVVYYEIYSDADKIVEAGSVQIEPAVIPGGQNGRFQVELNHSGKIRITLVRWQKQDRRSSQFEQMQFFPMP